MAARAKYVFRHNDVAHLEELLKAANPAAPKLIAFESVYSMEGEFSPTAGDLRPGREIRRADLYRRSPWRGHVRPARRRRGGARRHHGPHRHRRRHAGQGVRRDGRLYRRLAPNWCDCIRSFAPGFIFTTSLAPAIAAGALASIRHLKSSDAEREALAERAATLKRKFAAAGLPVMESHSHIVPLMVGDAVLCKQVSDALLKRSRRLCPADQLSHRAARHRAAALHARRRPTATP